MADSYYKLVGTTNPHTDWTTEVVLERDEDGNVTKSIGGAMPSTLTAADRKKVEAMGYSLESVSKEEAEEVAATSGVGGDVTGSAPVFGTSEAPNQTAGRSGTDQK